MSSRFSNHNYDDRPLSSPRSLVDLTSPYTPRSRARSGSLGAEEEHEGTSMQIDTDDDLTVRKHTKFFFFVLFLFYFSETENPLLPFLL